MSFSFGKMLLSLNIYLQNDDVEITLEKNMTLD